MKYVYFLFITVLFTGSGYAQTFELSHELREISGIESLGKDKLVAINDGGNPNTLYVLSFEGKLEKTVKVVNAENVDWEDIASDSEYLYIGDIGNNLNKRKFLCIYKVKKSDVLNDTEVKAEKITFSYQEQTSFPPSKAERFFDAEALFHRDGKLYILTKTNDEPWSGKSWVYELPIIPGNYELKKHGEIVVGTDGWYKDAITAADYMNGKIYFSTYDRIVTCDDDFENIEVIYTYTEATQKESLLVLSNGLFVADERHSFLGGGYLYRIEIKK